VTKEQLIAMGLNEEQATKVMESLSGNYVTKTRFNEINESTKQLKKDIEDRDKQLEDLKKVDAEGLQKKITELQDSNKKNQEDYEAKIKETQLSSALKLALNGKVHDADLVTGLIDKTKIELGEDGNVSKGLDEQIKTLQESKSFLFVTENKAPGIKGATPPGGDPSNPGGGSSDDFGKKVADLAKNSNDLEKARNSYFE